jgi:hypothetical protein
VTNVGDDQRKEKKAAEKVVQEETDKVLHFQCEGHAFASCSGDLMHSHNPTKTTCFFSAIDKWLVMRRWPLETSKQTVRIDPSLMLANKYLFRSVTGTGFLRW